MSAQRKYLDRGRQIALEGRPLEPDWMTLLCLGRNAVETGHGDDAPFLSAVMWDGVGGLARFPRPAVMDHPLMLSWLEVNEQEAVAYLSEQWARFLDEPAPVDAEGARAMLGREDCLAASLGGHYMIHSGFALPEGAVTWYVGFCSSCLRALLLWINDEIGSVEWWPFYDQEAA